MGGSKLSFFCLGLGSGACFGLLIAPAKGHEIRQRLRAKASERGDFVRQRGGELVHQAEQILDKGRATVALRRERLTAALEAGREAYRRAVEEDLPMAPGPASE